MSGTVFARVFADLSVAERERLAAECRVGGRDSILYGVELGTIERWARGEPCDTIRRSYLLDMVQKIRRDRDLWTKFRHWVHRLLGR